MRRHHIITTAIIVVLLGLSLIHIQHQSDRLSPQGHSPKAVVPILTKGQPNVIDILDAEGNDKTCPKHGDELLQDIVPVIPANPSWLVTQRTQFPFANSRCHIYPAPNSVTKAKVLYCPKCRKAEQHFLFRIATDGA